MSEKQEYDTPSSSADGTKTKASLFSLKRAIGPIKNDHGDLPLLACCFVTGMIDTATFANYSVFVGMQTGNTVILGLSTAGLPSDKWAWLTTLVSISSFLIGAFVTFRVSKFMTPGGAITNRLWTAFLFFVQGLFIVISAALATPDGLIPQNQAGTARGQAYSTSTIEDINSVALIPALAFQNGIQIATSRLLGFNELPVNVLTSTYCDLMGDYKLFALNNVKRNRRFVAVVLVLSGAISSGWIMRSYAGLKGVLWLAAGIKLLAGLILFLAMPEQPRQELP